MAERRPQRDLQRLLGSLQPRLQPGRYVFAVLPPGHAMPAPAQLVASMREPEGITVVLAEPDAAASGLEPLFVAAWLTLQVDSDLAAVGLTAAFAAALAAAGIACNVIAGVHHDHLFVPVEQAATAMGCLQDLQRRAGVGDA